MKKVLFVFSHGRKERILQGGAFPREFFWGYFSQHPEIEKEIFQVEKLTVPAAFELLKKFLDYFSGKIGINLLFFFQTLRNLDFFSRFDTMILTNEAPIIVFGILKQWGMLKSRLICFPMGIFDFSKKRKKDRLFKKILSGLELFPIGKPEQKFLEKQLRTRKNIRYIPFGIDCEFWFPSAEKPEPYVFSMGNDRHRDFPLLISVWEDCFPELKILSSIPLVCSPRKNVNVFKSDWRSMVFSDEQVRCLFQNSLFVVVPQAEAIYTAGQSVCLQAMACGKPVIISKTVGFWDLSVMKNTENCIMVKPGDEKELSRAIRFLLAYPAERERIGKNARLTVEKEFSSDLFGRELDQIILQNPHGQA